MSSGFESKMAMHTIIAERIPSLDQEQDRLTRAAQQALAHLHAGRFSEAEAGYRALVAAQPGNAIACNNLANALHAQGRTAEALPLYEAALRLLPAVAALHANHGKALAELGRFDEAERSLKSALALDPASATAHNDLGTLYQRIARLDEAAQHYREAIAREPGFAVAHANLASTLKGLGDAEQAEKHLRLSIGADPASADAHVRLGVMLRERGADDEAQSLLERAVALDPESTAARWAWTMSQLPVVPSSAGALRVGRERLEAGLAVLEDWLTGDRVRRGWDAVGIPPAFQIAYQEISNRELLGRYGRLCCRVLGQWQGERGLGCMPPGGNSGKFRIGIVSAHVHEHSVWHALVRGWAERLDKGRFELHLFSLDARSDAETVRARGMVDAFVTGRRPLAAWAETIRQRRLHVLLYPEVGMDPTAAKLACLRLAPVQAASWGHPETTGLPSMDFFLSGRDLEPQAAQSAYTERLVCLPGLGSFCFPSSRPETDPGLATLGLDPGQPLLISPGTPYKYDPRYDGVLAEIARRLPGTRLVFFGRPQDRLALLLRERLTRAFTAAGLAFDDHATFIPWLDPGRFRGLLRRSTVFLDTIGFSGFNTALQAVESGLPVVTREGRFMRGRLAGAILRRAGASELVAPDEAGYVELAVALAGDAIRRARLRGTLQASLPQLHGDMEAIRGLEDFLAEAAGQA